MRAWFVSDIHLRGRKDPRSQQFADFLVDLAKGSLGEVTHLFLVGDVFDLWVGRGAHLVDEYSEIVTAIRDLRARGIEVHYFEGNHDLHLSSFWEKDLGIDIHSEPAEFQLGSLRVRVEHGDQMNPQDRGYIFLRWLLRTRVIKVLVRTLPSLWVSTIGSSMSRISRRWTHGSVGAASGSAINDVRNQSIREMIERHVRALTDLRKGSTPFDFLISGHVHVRDDRTFSFSGRPLRSINLGCWPGADRYDRSREEAMAFVLADTQTEWISIRNR